MPGHASFVACDLDQASPESLAGAATPGEQQLGVALGEGFGAALLGLTASDQRGDGVIEHVDQNLAVVRAAAAHAQAIGHAEENKPGANLLSRSDRA